MVLSMLMLSPPPADAYAVKYYSPTTYLCIIRVARDPYRTAWAAVTLLSSIEGQACIPNVIHVSGLSEPVILLCVANDDDALC